MEGDVITLQDLFLFDHQRGLRRARPHPRHAQVDRAAARSSSRSSQAAGVQLDPCIFAFERFGGDRRRDDVRPRRPSPARGRRAAIAKPVLVFALLAFFLGTTVLDRDRARASSPGRAGPRSGSAGGCRSTRSPGRQARLEQPASSSTACSGNSLARPVRDRARGAGRPSGGASARSSTAGSRRPALPMRTAGVAAHPPRLRRRARRCCSSASAGGALLAAVCGLVARARRAVDLPQRPRGPPRERLPRPAARHPAAARRQPAGRATRCRRPSTPSCARAQPPMSVEFNRALVESRLGVPVEDALEGIATRM